MELLKLDLWTLDVGAKAESPAEFAQMMVSRVLSSWESGADVVCFPEFAWMGLERFISGPDKLIGVAHLFWDELWPEILLNLKNPLKAVVAGTAPFIRPDGSLTNRAPIVSSGVATYQEKIHLTPWESAFTGGGPLRIWNFRGCRIAVVICLDIEIPEISVALRGAQVDLILVPSATESIHGIDRVGRCASARAVELGCFVGVSHLVGKTPSELIDQNIGRLAVFTPSQSPFELPDETAASPIYQEGFHRLSYPLSMTALARNRGLTGETDPSKITPARIGIHST